MSERGEQGQAPLWGHDGVTSSQHQHPGSFQHHHGTPVLHGINKLLGSGPPASPGCSPGLLEEFLSTSLPEAAAPHSSWQDEMMGRPPPHHGHSLPPLPGTPKLFYQVSHPQKSHQHPAVSRTSPATQTSSGSAPPNTRSVSSLAYRARPSPALLPPQPSLLGVVPTGAALQEGARDHSQLQAASQPSGSRICWLLQQSHRYGAELLRPGRARRGQTLSQQQTNSSPSTRPAAGPGERSPTTMMLNSKPCFMAFRLICSRMASIPT